MALLVCCHASISTGIGYLAFFQKRLFLVLFLSKSCLPSLKGRQLLPASRKRSVGLCAPYVRQPVLQYWSRYVYVGATHMRSVAWCMQCGMWPHSATLRPERTVGLDSIQLDVELLSLRFPSLLDFGRSSEQIVIGKLGCLRASCVCTHTETRRVHKAKPVCDVRSRRHACLIASRKLNPNWESKSLTCDACVRARAFDPSGLKIPFDPFVLEIHVSKP